jgi:hypothetical protein
LTLVYQPRLKAIAIAVLGGDADLIARCHRDGGLDADLGALDRPIWAFERLVKVATGRDGGAGEPYGDLTPSRASKLGHKSLLTGETLIGWPRSALKGDVKWMIVF